MALRLERLTPQTKYCLALLGALFLWIVPVSIKAPKFIILASLSGSIGTFLYAYRLAETLQIQGHSQALEKKKHKDLINYQYALEEDAIRRELYAQYFPETQQPTINQPPQLIPPAQEMPAPPTEEEESETAQMLVSLVRLSSNYGWLSASAVKRKSAAFKNCPAERVRELFYQLVAGGLGQTRGEGNKLEWAIDPNSADSSTE